MGIPLEMVEGSFRVGLIYNMGVAYVWGVGRGGVLTPADHGPMSYCHG